MATDYSLPPRPNTSGTAFEYALLPRLIDLLPDYERFLQGRGRRPRGIRTYMSGIRRFLTYTGADATVEALSLSTIIRYRDSYAQGHKPPTVKAALSEIHSFCFFCMRYGHLAEDPMRFIDYPRIPDRSPRALSRAQLHTLTQAFSAESPRRGWHKYHTRNQRAMVLLLYTGLRLSEAAALLWQDVDLETLTITVRPEHSKFGRARAVPIHPRLALELRKVEAPNPDHAVIEGRNGQPLNPKSFAHIFERWLVKLGLDITAHQLRHTFATELLRSGADLERIRQALGHRRLDSTQVYLNVTSDHLQEAVNLLPAGW
jgi:site-specific recombinase XerD